jgi:hypothetical protein
MHPENGFTCLARQKFLEGEFAKTRTNFGFGFENDRSPLPT